MISQAQSIPQNGTDIVLDELKKRSIPVTRANYLALAYPEGVPKPWTAELEAQLPEVLQKR
jgi:hypothetical protein